MWGQYMTTTTSDLPDKLEDGKLIFRNNRSDDCDKKLVTIIDLSIGLPRHFFRECKDKSGDIYTFTSD